jgi:hypothetical protein
VSTVVFASIVPVRNPDPSGAHGTNPMPICARTASTPFCSTSRARWGSYGAAEPARFTANAFAASGSPVYLYRFSYVQGALREQFRAGAPREGSRAAAARRDWRTCLALVAR